MAEALTMKLIFKTIFMYFTSPVKIVFNLTGYPMPATQVVLFRLLPNSLDRSMDSVMYISDGALKTMT